MSSFSGVHIPCINHNIIKEMLTLESMLLAINLFHFSALPVGFGFYI